MEVLTEKEMEQRAEKQIEEAVTQSTRDEENRTLAAKMTVQDIAEMLINHTDELEKIGLALRDIAGGISSVIDNQQEILRRLPDGPKQKSFTESEPLY